MPSLTSVYLFYFLICQNPGKGIGLTCHFLLFIFSCFLRIRANNSKILEVAIIRETAKAKHVISSFFRMRVHNRVVKSKPLVTATINCVLCSKIQNSIQVLYHCNPSVNLEILSHRHPSENLVVLNHCHPCVALMLSKCYPSVVASPWIQSRYLIFVP